jgi:hypothetical protein
MRFRGAIFEALAVGLLLASAPSVRAQQDQFLPEIDLHYEFNPHARLFVQAKDDRDGGDPPQATVGPSIMLYRKPLMRLQRPLAFDLDTTKSRLIVIETGYRIITAPDTAVENRLIEAATFHYPLLHQVLIADRNRFDLDWQNGQFTWRYRNRLSLERTFAIRSFHFAPYVSAEPFYESQYGKWASTDLYAGSAFPIGKHVEFDAYYEHENDTGKSPNKQNNYAGLQLQLYFSRAEQATQGQKAGPGNR